MKEIKVSAEYFDLEAFLARTVEFLRESMSPEVDPSYGIVWVQGVGEVPVFGPESGWDVLHGLKEEGKMVFFPFAFKDGDETLACTDGNSYGPASDDEESEDQLVIGLEDAVGYLLQVKEGTVIISSAIHAGGACPGPAPGVDIHSDCGVLEEPMVRFIEGFTRSEKPAAEPVIDEHLRFLGWMPTDQETTRELCGEDFDGLNVEAVFLVDRRVAAILETRPPGSDLPGAVERAGYCSLIYQERTGNAAPLAIVRDQNNYYCHNLKANAAPLHLSGMPTPRQLYEFLHPQAEEFQGTLRGYQRDAVSQVLLSILSARRRIYLQMAGGTGKTITAAATIAKLRSLGLIGKTLFLVDRDALASQSVKKLIKHLGEHFAVGRAEGGDEDEDKEVLVSTVQHLATGDRYSGYSASHFGLVILDECHRSYFGAWLPVLNHFSAGGAILMGLTATPSDRETVNTDRFFTDEGQSPGPIFRYTEDQGENNPHVPEWERLASCEHYTVTTDVDLEAVEDIGFDFEPEQLGKAVDVPQRNRLVAETYFDSIVEDGHLVKTIVFAASIAHAKNLTNLLIAEYKRRNDLPEDHAGAEKLIVCVHHEMSNAVAIIEEFQKVTGAAERRAIINQAMAPLVLVGVGMLDTGIDVPDLQVLLMARPTMSKILYAQMKARGTRKCKEAGKTSYKLVDFIDLPRNRQVVTYETLKVEDEDMFETGGASLQDLPRKARRTTENQPPFQSSRLVVYVPDDSELAASASPELLALLHRRLETLLQGRVAKEILRFRFAHALLTWRYFRGNSQVDAQFMAASGFDLASLREVYDQPHGTWEEIAAAARQEFSLPTT